MLHRSEKSAVELIWGPPGTGKSKAVVTLLLTLLQMNCRTLVCAPTNVAITEIASRVVNMLTEVESNSLFCSFGEVLLFGDKERLKVGSDVEKIYLDYRLKRLAECLGPQTGWRHCFASMIDFLESKSDSKVGKGMCKSFLELIRDRFVSTASPLRYCISILHTHMAKNYISLDNVQNMVLLINLVDSFGSLLFQDNVTSEALEYIFCRSDIDDTSETYDDNSFLLVMNRRECLKVLYTLFASLDELHIPNFVEQQSLIEFCFQKASLIFCTASSSYKLHKLAMEPLSIVVIDEAAQLKDCESTVPLQLLGVKHVILVGDECQLPATVKSIVSDEGGFARSLFERLCSVGHSKYLLIMQYRMHPSISFFPNSRFFNNMILDAPNLKSRSQEKHYLKGSMFGPYSFINVIGGREEMDEDGRSRKNVVEVAIVSQMLQNLYIKWVESKKKLSIGIVSPYAAEVVAIEEKLAQKYNNLDGFTVKVRTVDSFQGGEEDIIILSTVSKNQQSLEFVSKLQRINVSLTRARHCLWILGNETILCDDEPVWKAVVLDAKNRQCFFNADEDKDLAKAIFEVKKQYDQLDDLLNADSILFSCARWKVLFSDNFLKSFKKLTSVRLKRSALNVLLKLASGWRPKEKNSEIICSSSSLQKKFKVENLYVVCTTDIAKDSIYFQVLKIRDILPIEDVPTLANHLDRIINKYADGFINLCKEKRLEGDLEVPKSWPPSLELLRSKDLSFTKMQNDVVADTCDGKSYAENSQVSESLLLMKFYSLSSGVVNHLLSDCEGRELDLPFEVTDQEVEIILHQKSSFIVGRSGTGKTTVLTMKLFQKEQWHQFAQQGCYTSQSSKTEQSSAANEKKVLHQLFVTVSPKLCYAIKRHVSHLKSFACGGSHSTESSLIEFDEDEAQFNDIQDSFHDIPTHSYLHFITFHKLLIMVDGTLSNSYFERFLDVIELIHGHLRSSRSAALQNFLRTKEVNYERFSTLYWPHFNTDLTKRLDASRVFTEIISHVKGGMGAIEACDGKLRREDYVQLSEIRVSNLTRQEREAIYDIFQMYEKKMEKGEFELADLVTDLHHRLTDGNYDEDLMDFVYVDEVQDLTMSQIDLFKHMCHNVEEGFVFSGDTAQTIARGIDFRFQELRHLFYKKFVLESRANKHEESKEKGQVSEILHLTQNFCTHDGILKLSQSIIDLLYHFPPLSIDVLKPESSLIYGEALVLLESGENENAIVKIFGNIVGFGAEQVILVQDYSARKEISKFVGKHALVLTIVECKGLEFQDVLLYNFFGSSPSKNQWRVIYDCMNELHLLDHTLPKGFPGFDVAKHNILCSELKQLYVAVTRMRQRLWICENLEELSKAMFDYWKKKCLVQVKQLDETLALAMQVASSPEEWKSRGIKVIEHLKNSHVLVPPPYEESFKKEIIMSFRQQSVYDPISQDFIHLSDLSQHIAKGIAEGGLDPFTDMPLQQQEEKITANTSSQSEIHGTTCLVFVTENIIYIGGDGRASDPVSGSLVADHYCKIFHLNEGIAAVVAGGSLTGKHLMKYVYDRISNEPSNIHSAYAACMDFIESWESVNKKKEKVFPCTALLIGWEHRNAVVYVVGLVEDVANSYQNIYGIGSGRMEGTSYLSYKEGEALTHEKRVCLIQQAMGWACINSPYSGGFGTFAHIPIGGELTSDRSYYHMIHLYVDNYHDMQIFMMCACLVVTKGYIYKPKRELKYAKKLKKKYAGVRCITVVSASKEDKLIIRLMRFNKVQDVPEALSESKDIQKKRLCLLEFTSANLEALIEMHKSKYFERPTSYDKESESIVEDNQNFLKSAWIKLLSYFR